MRRNSGVTVGKRPGRPAVAAAFDALRFGREQTLDLRASLPTGAEATRRTESFLRERQVAGSTEVLVITGRGNQSVDGIPVVRPAVVTLLAKLRRLGVVAAWQEHTPGSFVVEPASIRTLLEAPRRHRMPAITVLPDPAEFTGLSASTRRVLQRLAVRSLEALGAPTGESFVQDEMQRQFSVLAASVPAGPHREARLCAAAERALDEMDDAE